MKKSYLISIVSLLVVLIVALGVVWYYMYQTDSDNSLDQNNSEEPLIGGDQDEHGCLGAAGYSWCPSTEKCQRMWENYCEEYKDVFREEVAVTDYDSCVKAGYPIMESYPEQCSDGTNTYTHQLDKILLDNLEPGQKISSPLQIKGRAHGYWYFEGSFPVILTDWDGLIIAEGYATAQDEWMGDQYVPFVANLTFEKPIYKNNGSLIFQKDNPSGLSENDDAFEIGVLFE